MQNNIKKYREKKNMTQQELADKVGVRRETIVFLEKGTYNPSLKLASDVASIFNISLEKLFNLKGGER